jgi:hypothetical protein
MGEYREADNRDEFCMETLDEFVEETFNDDHDSWYDFSPQTLTIDDIQALLMTHKDHCEHQKEELDFIVPPPDSIHDLLVNYGYFKATHDDRERLQIMTRVVFHDLDAVVAILEAEH